MQELIIKWVINWAAAWLIKKIGHTEAAQHIEEMMIKNTPLPDDPLPSPSELRKPRQPWLK